MQFIGYIDQLLGIYWANIVPINYTFKVVCLNLLYNYIVWVNMIKQF